MVQITIIASLVTTLIFSAMALKIMGDAEKVLPTPVKMAAKTCDSPLANSLSF